MAITKSAKKAIRQSDKRKQHNLVYRNKIKGLIKEVRGLILAKRIDEAKKVLPKLYQALDKAAKVGVIKKKYCLKKKIQNSKTN